MIGVSSSSNKRIARNTVFLSVRMVIVLVINLFTTRIILHALGVTDYGVYNVVCGFVAMFAFLNTSMSNGIQRFFNYEYGKNGIDSANKVYCLSLLIQASLALLIIILVEPIGLWYLHNKMVIPENRMLAADWIFQFSIISFVFGIMQAPYAAAITAHERLDFYAIVSVADALLKFIISYFINLVSSDKLIIYGLLMAFVSVFDLIAYYIYCKKHFKEISYKPLFDKQMFKSMLGFSGWNLFGSFSGVMVNQGINLVINFFYGPAINAARGVALQVNGAVHSFVSNISIPVRPQVTQSYARGDMSRTMNLTYGISKISSVIILLLAIPASLEINFLLRLWLGDMVPAHTNYFTIIILSTSLITNLNWAISGVVHASGIMRDYQVFCSIIKIVSVPSAFVLLKYYDLPELALIAVLLCEGIAHTVGLLIVKKIVGMSLSFYFKEVILPLFFLIVSSLVVLYPIMVFVPEGFLRLMILVVVNTIIVCGLTYVSYLNPKERIVVKQMLTNTILKKFKNI